MRLLDYLRITKATSRELFSTYRIQSMATISVMSSGGKPTEVSTITMVTRPAWGIPAAPMLAAVAVMLLRARRVKSMFSVQGRWHHSKVFTVTSTLLKNSSCMGAILFSVQLDIYGLKQNNPLNTTLQRWSHILSIYCRTLFGTVYKVLSLKQSHLTSQRTTFCVSDEPFCSSVFLTSFLQFC